MFRNLSVERYFEQRAIEHTPRYRFAGSTKDDWQKWHDELLPQVKATLGHMPDKVPLNPQILAEWESDGLIKQKVVFDVERGLSATAFVLRPADASSRLPGILACHGHGPGKDPIAGIQLQGDGTVVEETNYGLRMAQAGYAVITIDWRGFGERDDRRSPHHHDVTAGWRDLCNVHYLRATMLGQTVLGMDVHDGMAALDYLCEQPFVDPDRLGVMGLSFGGTMTTWLSICDERLKAADIICYSDRFADFAMRRGNTCGSQITPGLFELCDMPDLQGLTAPRPLLVEIGTSDICFAVDSAMSCYHEVEKIYAAAGVPDRLELDLFDGGHRWGANKSFDFFGKYL